MRPGHARFKVTKAGIGAREAAASATSLDIGIRHRLDPGHGACIIPGDIRTVGDTVETAPESVKIGGVDHPRSGAAADHGTAQIDELPLGVDTALRTAQNDVPTATLGIETWALGARRSGASDKGDGGKTCD